MVTSADIVIVGAGLHGASLAYHLARGGAGRIVVLEKRHVAAGPTAKSGAMVRPLFSDAIYIRLVLEATAMFEQWSEIVGGDPGFVQNGFLRITEGFDLATLGADLDLMTRLGAPFELIAAAELRARVPYCTIGDTESGVLLTKGGFADAIKTTEALVAAAKRLGVTFIEDSPVTAIETAGGKVQAVLTPFGRIATGLVVNCAGAWSDRVAAMVGVTLPIEIHRVPTALYRKPESLRAPGPILSDGINQIYLRDAGENYLRAARFGWTADRVDPDTYDETLGREQHDDVRRSVDKRVPAMRRTPSVGGFSAIYDMTPDGHPIVGRVGDIEGFWCDCGWSGNGFAGPPVSAAQLTVHPYPAPTPVQQQLVGLWRTEWTRTDYDWLEALNGDYADTLAITAVVAQVGGEPAATASVLYAKGAPETCLIGNVITARAHRGRGLGQQVTEAAVEIGFAAGCTIAMLGSSRHDGNVYERCGFRRVAGSIMRRDAPGTVTDSFAPGQPTLIRTAGWGDMPGFARFIAEPLSSVTIDYPRGLCSPAFVEPLRCVSAFTAVREDVHGRAGLMLVLASATGRRLFGLATLTPGPAPARTRSAVIDFAAHDNYAASAGDLLAQLLDEAVTRHIDRLEAYAAVADTAKLRLLQRRGFEAVETLSGDLQLRAGRADVIRLRRLLP